MRRRSVGSRVLPSELPRALGGADLFGAGNSSPSFYSYSGRSDSPGPESESAGDRGVGGATSTRPTPEDPVQPSRDRTSEDGYTQGQCQERGSPTVTTGLPSLLVR